MVYISAYLSTFTYVGNKKHVPKLNTMNGECGRYLSSGAVYSTCSYVGGNVACGVYNGRNGRKLGGSRLSLYLIFISLSSYGPKMSIQGRIFLS